MSAMRFGLGGARFYFPTVMASGAQARRGSRRWTQYRGARIEIDVNYTSKRY
jgi:hypothetical protein